MAVKDNTGAITIRCPKKEPDREEYLKMKDLMDAEILQNKARKEGRPTSYAMIFREMATQRYAEQLGIEKADAARVDAEKAGEEAPPLASTDDLF